MIMQNIVNPSQTSEGAFVVVLREVVIATDIAQTIAEVYPEAQVILARTLDEAEAAIPEGVVVAVVFAAATPAAYAASALARRVRACGGRVVLTGNQAEERVGFRHAPENTGSVNADGFADWSILRFPFAREDVLALLFDGFSPR